MKGRGTIALVCALITCGVGAATAEATRYVALGDSYSSGTGTRTYYDTGCQRSVYAYPYLLHNAHPDWTFVHAACSGAKTGLTRILPSWNSVGRGSWRSCRPSSGTHRSQPLEDRSRHGSRLSPILSLSPRSPS